MALKAKLEQTSGRIDNSILMYKELLNNEWFRFHSAINFELMWCYALKCDWSQCINYAEPVRKNTEHSPTFTTYAEAVFSYVKSIDDCDPNMKQKASKLMESVFYFFTLSLKKTYIN